MGILSPSSRVSTGPRFFPTGEFLTRSEPGVRQTPSSKESIITWVEGVGRASFTPPQL